MDDIAAQNRSTNASDVGLIVQGSLILLSAIVALLGYSVQAKLKKKERRVELEEQHRDYLRKAELDLLRTKLRTFVGPAAQLAMSGWNTMWRNCFATKMLRGMGACEAHQGSGLPAVSLNSLAGGDRIHNYWNDTADKGGMGFTFMPGMMKGEFNSLTSFVGPEIEAEIRSDPNSKLSKHYFRFCRRIIKRYFIELRDLIKKYCQTLDVRQSASEFKKDYPVLAGAGWLRNLLYVDFIEWVNSFEEILELWDAGEYDILFPEEVDYPLQIVRCFTNQLTELRNKETELGTAQHKVMGQSNEDDRITNMLKKSIKSSASSTSIEATNEKKVVSEKYVAEKVEMKEK
jgi:hypothetical protein